MFVRRWALPQKLAGIPLLVHEQNAVPGMTTRLLAPIATVVMAGLPLRKSVIKRAQWVGNPLRRDIEQLAQRVTGCRKRPSDQVAGGRR